MRLSNQKWLGLSIAVWSLLVFANNTLGEQESSQRIKKQLVGTWKLVSYDVGTTHPMGRDPVGLLIYTGDGRMSLQAMLPGRPRFVGEASTGHEHGTPEEVVSAYGGYIAYFGTYEVNERGSVTHRIEGSLFPNWVGRDQIELFKLSGDRLEFGIDPIRYTWKRVR